MWPSVLGAGPLQNSLLALVFLHGTNRNRMRKRDDTPNAKLRTARITPPLNGRREVNRVAAPAATRTPHRH